MAKTILMTWIVIVLLMTIAWFMFLWKKNPGIIDVFWSIAISIAGLIFSLVSSNNPIKITLQLLLIIWAVRLAAYLFWKRILPRQLDMRYEDLSQGWKMSKNIGFFLNFQLQGFLAIVIASPFIFINQIHQLHFLTTLAIIVVIIGIIGESMADLQLQKFKQLKKNGVCNIALWHYSRHPNYFFEWLIWLGFSLAGFATSFGWFGLISPLMLLFLMIRVTGPLTEKQSIKSRGDAYIMYQKRTSMFIPWLPKKEK